MKKFLLLFLCVLAGSLFAAYTPTTTTTYKLTDGVTYNKYTYASLYGGYQEIYVLEVDLSKDNLEVAIGLCVNNLRESTASLGNRYGALAAVNLGFFDMATPTNAVGLVKAQGRYFKSNNGTLSSYTEGYFWVHNKYAGVAVPKKFNAGMADNIRWGYPVLVQQGKVYNELLKVTSDSSGIILSRRARTALGVSSTRQKLYMVVVDEYSGRHAVTCKELADYMISLGCYEAFNADGGGSSTMWTKAYGRMNKPQGGTYQRPVGDILFVRERKITTNETQTGNPPMPNPGTPILTPKDER